MKKFRIEYQDQTIRGYIEEKTFWFDLNETSAIFKFSKESVLQTCTKDEKKRIPYNDGKQTRYKSFINQFALGRAILRGRDKKCKEAQTWFCEWLMPSLVDYLAFGFFVIMENGASRQLSCVLKEWEELCNIVINSESSEEISAQHIQDLQRIHELQTQAHQIYDKIQAGYNL